MQSESVANPVVLDLEHDDDDTLRHKAQEALSGPSGMFALRNYGFEQLVQQVRDATRTQNQLAEYSGNEKCISCELTDELSITLKHRCKGVASRLCDTLFGPEFREGLEKTQRTIDGRQSMRYYPGNKGAADGSITALGAHVDHTLFTMLWPDGPGLQVISTEEAAVQASSVGLPTIGPSMPAAVDEASWADVGDFWERGMLLVTVGQEWIDLSAANGNDGMRQAKRAALHRVVIPNCERHSIPFLVRVVSEAESDANSW